MRAFLFLLLLVSNAYAADVYVRVDGGSPTQCDGTADAPIVATHHCAYAHPFWVLPPNLDGDSAPALMKGGDTLHIGPGQYQMGLPVGGSTYQSCRINWPWDCHMQPVPSGTAAQHTKIIGPGAVLWGSGGSSVVLNLTGSSYVDISGLEITDHSGCIKKHTDASMRCPELDPNAPPFALGPWAANGIADTAGGADTVASSYVALTNVNVHGMAKFGMLVGNIHNWTMDHVQVVANGFGGISLDTGPTPSSGTNTFTHIEVGYNGCTENYPSLAIWGCWGQETGGYGDGIGSSSTSDQGVWLFQDSLIHDNTQDGIDFLHGDKSITLTYNRVNAYRNSGNQLKTSGTATISNSVINGWCSALVGKFYMKGSAGGATAGDQCRALGDPIQMSQAPGLSTILDHNTIISQGNTFVTVPSTGFGDATSKLAITNNIMIGQPRWVKNDGSPPAIWWWGDGTPIGTPTWTGNVFFQTGVGACPAGNLCIDPKLVNETFAAFDPTPTAATPPNVGAITGVVVTPPPVCPAVCVPKVVYTLNTNGHLDVGAACQ